MYVSIKACRKEWKIKEGLKGNGLEASVGGGDFREYSEEKRNRANSSK